MVYHGLGDEEEALLWLERAFEGRDVLLSAFLTVEPVWNRLRAAPRFKAILNGINLG